MTTEARNAFLDGEHHWCDICKTPFEELADLIRHDCSPTEKLPEHVRDRLEASVEEAAAATDAAVRDLPRDELEAHLADEQDTDGVSR